MPSAKKQFIFLSITALFSLGLMEATSYFGLWWLEQYKDVRYEPVEFKELPAHYEKTIKEIADGKAETTRFSRTLGWEPKPNVSLQNEWYRGTYTTNSRGMRSHREYAETPASDVTRIATFGESFTEGGEVGDDESWQAQLSTANHEFETLNFGVSGYGMDQAYLRYVQQGDGLNEHVAILGYMIENLNRSVNTFVPFYVGERAAAPVTKPRFVFENNELTLISNPIQEPGGYYELLNNPRDVLPRLGQHDSYYNARPKHSALDVLATVRLAKLGYYKIRSIDGVADNYAADSESFVVTTAILEAFYKQAVANGAVPLILVYPSYWGFVNFHFHKERAYQNLIDWLNVKGYAHLDLMQPMIDLGENSDVAAFFVAGVGHYSAFGNSLVAKAVKNYLTENGLTDPNVRQTERARLKVILQP